MKNIIRKVFATFLSIGIILSAPISLDYNMEDPITIVADAANNVRICNVDIGIELGSYMQFTNKDGTASNSGYYYNGYYLAASQCFGFARWCQYKLFGYNSGTSSSKFYKLSVNGLNDISAGSLTTSNLKTMIQAAKPGAHLLTRQLNNLTNHKRCDIIEI